MMFSFFKKKKNPPPAAAPTPAPTEAPQAPPLIVPRIKHVNFLQAVQSIQGVTNDSLPITQPFVGDLLVAYVMDMDEGYIAVTPASLRKYGIDLNDLHTLAIVNALSALQRINLKSIHDVCVLEAPDNLTACTALYPELWQQIEDSSGGPVLAAFPHRDIALYVRADAPNAVSSLQQVMNQLDFNDTHALSKLVYQRVDNQWSPVDPLNPGP